MQFPNAHAGVKKIYKATVIALISVILLVIASVLVLAGAAGGSGAGVLGGAALFIVIAILMIIAFIMNLVGLVKAKKDEKSFNIALIFTIVGIIAAIVVGSSQSGTLLNSLGDDIRSICSFLSTWFVCTGIINLADRLNDSAMSERGMKTRRVLMVVWILAIVLKIIGDVVGSNAGTPIAVVALVLALIAGIMEIVTFFLYLKLLGRARTMLEA